MLTKRENLTEVMKRGKPDRFVNQYEAFALLFGAPVSPWVQTVKGGGPSKDGWGVTKIWPDNTPGAFPLQDEEHLVCPDITEWRKYVHAPETAFPDKDWAMIRQMAARVDRKEQFSLVLMTSGLFETCHNLLGMEECLISFYEEPEAMHELIDYITEYHLAAAGEICNHVEADGIFLHDDWGHQNSTFISPEMFKEFFVPAYKRIYAYYKSRGFSLVVHHSDSYAATLVPYMIDLGIDIWQGVLSCHNIPELIRQYGGQMSFMGGIDEGRIDVPDWTPDMIREEVARACNENGCLSYIPSMCQGLPGSTFPGVHEEVTKAISEMSRMVFPDSEKSLKPPAGTLRLCRNLLDTRIEDLEEEQIHVFKDRLLDMTGCIFGGAIVTEDRFFYDMLKQQGGAPEAPVFADSANIRLPVVSAVMHNALHARANDFGNMAMVVFGDPIASHYGETILPMNLTLADVYGVSGQTFIANNIAAEDTVGRLLYTLPVRFPTDMKLGSTAAAALAIRYEREMDAETAMAALSYAAVNSTDPGNAYYDYSQEFKYHNAESARMGIMAVALAKGGWRGMEDTFFGQDGLISRQVPDGGLPERYEKAFDDLGKTYFTEVRFKRGPGGMPTIAPAMMGLRLREQIVTDRGRFDAKEIRKVRIFQPEGMGISYYANPFRLRDHTNALFSYAFACCCSLYHGDRRADLVQTASILSNPELIRLAEETVIDTWRCTSKMPVFKAQAEMTDGHIYEAEADFVAEMFVYPDREMLEKKFWDQFNAFGRLPRSTGEKIIELAYRIDTLSDMREYTSLLCVPG